jgi:type VI secretion system protein ImpJ
MANWAVHWSEGMFLSPQHLQAAERHALGRLQETEDWYHPYGWGLRSIEFNQAALANFMVDLTSCEARFPDGTHLSIPRDATVAPVQLRDALSASASTTVYLAVPPLRLGQANVDKASSVHGPRFRIQEEECPDENGSESVSIEFRRPRVRLLLETEDRGDYVTLPLARIVCSAQTPARPQIAPAFVPPLLTVEAWPWLRRQIQDLGRRMRSKIETLADQMVARQLVFASQAPGDAERILKLAILNGIQARLEALAITAGITPMQVYLDLCGFAGQVAIFRRDRRPPQLIPYNHHDLGPCFLKTIEHIQVALEDVDLPPPYEMRPFVRVGERVEVRCEREWLAEDQTLYLGVETELPHEECEAQLQRLHMKIASADRVDDFFEKSKPGLQPVLEHRVPPGLPGHGNLVYFHFNRRREARTPREEAIWKDVVASRSLAIRVSLEQAELDQDGILTLKVRDGRPPKLRFTLFATQAK